MWKLAVLLLGLAVGVQSDCTCYETSGYVGKNAPISNSYNPDDFSACYTPCSFVAYSGDDTYGWTQLTFRWGATTNSGGQIQIFDGPAATGTPLIQIAEGEDVLDGSAKSKIKSSSPNITITYSQTGTGANVYYGVIKALPGLQPSAAPITTTSIPTTRSYTPGTFVRDPHLITHDVLVAINQKTSGGIVALTGMNGIAYNFVSQLANTTDVNSVSNSRISLATLTPYDPFYAVQGEIWGLNSDTFRESLPKSGVTIEGNIDEALVGLAKLAFTVNTNSSTDSRPNVQRTLVLITAEWPTTGATLDQTTIQPEFEKLGANLLVVGWNLTDYEQSQVLRPDRWYNAINANETRASQIAKFVNPFYFNDGSVKNYWCMPQNIKEVSDDTGATYAFFNEPANYLGPDGTTGKEDWSKVAANDGQKGRYCNFANSQYKYKKPDTAPSVKVSVYYELEAGRDLLSFYDDSQTLIVSFTGYDISEGSFYSSASTLTAVFTSDNKSIYRGFYVKITPQPASP